MNLRFPLLYCLPFLWCTPFWREQEPGIAVWEGERWDGLQTLVCIVLCSQINLEVIQLFSGSQFRSFLLNRSMQENGELKIESKIEEVSSFPYFVSIFSVIFVNISSFTCAPIFSVAACC